MPANSPKVPGSPMRAVTVPNANVVRTAPSLPEAAEMPWAVVRTRVGKTSTGIMKVVAEGPQLRKNLRVSVLIAGLSEGIIVINWGNRDVTYLRECEEGD